ncbi:MAG: hypothetical protein K9K76_07320 [Halanaerobiales bacterium]|nr:hypothetical protein [Halanaerobiales bacterium]
MKIVYWLVGLLIVIMVLLYLTSQFGHSSFQKKGEQEAKQILTKANLSQIETIEQKDLDGLPDPVKRWLNFSQIIGKEKIKTVRLKQKGLMRTSPGQKGMKTTADQYFNTQTPSFIWLARVNMAPLIYFAGKDKYNDGKGHMLIKVLSLFPVVDDRGEEMDQGTLTRYLGEIIWFPTAALSDYISWEEIDSESAKATMSYKGVTASAVFNFDEEGRVKSYNCERYYNGDDGYRLENYHAPVWDYQEFSGIKIPTQAKAVWKLESGDYEYYDMEITELEFNVDSTY